ncbi:MAG: EamA family transporter [Bacteroidales bacterium]|jgi:drug/metabolite transporter (DMT)-like permease|nr:EamA family transporter [Bacteroidales bacterium]MCK9499510.1 EamA family transporter [Bacteroidales bacterium]
MTKQNKAYLFAISTVICWASVGTAFKIALRYVNHVQMLFWSVLVALLVFCIILSFKKLWKQIFQQSKSQVFKSILIGFISPFVYYLVLFKAYDLLPAQEALTLNYIWPVVLVLLSIPVLKQKINFFSFMAILISFFGSFVIASKGKIFDFEFSNLPGVILAVLSTVIWSVFWLFNVKDKRNEIVKLFMCFLFGFLFILIYCIFTKNLALPEKNGMFALVYIGIFEMGLTFFLWMMALALSETTAKVSNLIYITPFLSLLVVSIVLKEKILITTIIGLILIILGIILQKKSNV